MPTGPGRLLAYSARNSAITAPRPAYPKKIWLPLVHVSNDVISKIETGERPPAEDFPPRLDAIPELETRGELTRLWGYLKKGQKNRAYGWFERWADIEANSRDRRPRRAARRVRDRRTRRQAAHGLSGDGGGRAGHG